MVQTCLLGNLISVKIVVEVRRRSTSMIKLRALFSLKKLKLGGVLKLVEEDALLTREALDWVREFESPLLRQIYTLGVTVAYAAPTRLVRVRIFEGMPYIISGGAEVGESGRAVNPLPLAEWVRIPPP